MATAAEKKQAYEQWKEHCKRVQSITDTALLAGETRIVNTSKSLVPVENRLPLIIGVSWDITDMKNAELEIVEARLFRCILKRWIVRMRWI